MFKKCILLLSVTFGLILLCTSCSRSTDTKVEKDEVARQKKEGLRQRVLEMAFRHGADVEWLSFLDGRAFYTIELQQVLLEPPGHLRLLLARVVDIFERDETYFLMAHEWLSDVYFQLQCNAGHAQYALSTSSNELRGFAEYAIVMQPKSVHRPVAQLTGEIDGDSVYVTHEVADIIIVKATCIEIISLDDSVLDVDDLLGPKSEDAAP